MIKKDIILQVRINANLKKQFEELTHKYNVSVSDYLRHMIIKELEKESKKMELIKSIKTYEYVLIDQDIEGNPIEKTIEKLDASLDSEIFNWLVEHGTPCTENGEKI